MSDNTDIEDSIDEATEIIPFTYSITSYGADYPIDGLVKRIIAGDILVPTFAHEELLTGDLDAFQREYVWPRSKADRFIESLLLGLPVPGIFLVKEPSGRLLVLDGHQRLFTLRAFYEGIIHGKEYKLSGIQPRFEGRSYKTLDVEDRRCIDDSIIHATIVKQDHPTEDWSSVYVIFERLNTGGVSLQPQEIRMALYHGRLAALLRQLNEHESWRAMMGAPSKRLKDIELILRFFALLQNHDTYESPMKNFLNRFMARNRNLDNTSAEEFSAIFKPATDALYQVLGDNAFRPERSINAAFADALLTGFATALLYKIPITPDGIIRVRQSLLQDSEFVSAITTGTSQEAKVRKRVTSAIKAFMQPS